jgi:ABC-2 type transport system permease protein
MNTNVLRAVFKRNFVSYFASPTGYVFICVFVLLSAAAAFWPNEFFSANLANLDQLNKLMPFILLIFVPAVTMGIWAEEGRQGTDELLLTIPAGDLEIVLGKYLAAVAIYTASLLFSLLCNYLLLLWLGTPDGGLFLATYFGYWLLGLAMLSVGMVASFLTRNLTVAYILGALFNAPLVIIGLADAMPTLARNTAVAVKQWSFGGQFQGFGRGILTFSALVYFLLIVAVMLYVSMVLIGRRHWVRGGSWYVLGLHFLVRGLALAAVTAGAVYFFHNHDLRLDATSEKLSSLSVYTNDLIDELKTDYAQAETKRPVRIEAFISPEVPEPYIQTRLNLLTMLRELKARAGDMMEMEINETEKFGPMAERARKRYDITPKRVADEQHGEYKSDEILMGVAITCGRERVVLPFIDRGTPVEYELVRSLCTVTEQKRKRIGVVTTDAPVFGSYSMQGGQSPAWPIITELQKQYEVVQVSPAQPIPLKKTGEKSGKGEKGEKGGKDEGFDVLLAIQPSAMGPQEMENFLAAIRSGQPTVIFEDPFPFFAPEVPGTTQRRHPSDPSMAMFMQQNLQKGKIGPLWRLLGVNFSGDDGRDVFHPFASEEEESPGGADQVVWQDYNPHPQLPAILTDQLVSIDKACGNKAPFCEDDPISSKLQHLCFPTPGYIEKRNTADLKDRTFTALVSTSSKDSGTVRAGEIFIRDIFGRQELNPDPPRIPGNVEYVLAAHIKGRLPAAEKSPAQKGQDPKAKAEAKPSPPDADIDVVLVADIDMLTEQFFRLREQGDIPGMNLDFDNVTLVLNALDALAGDARFLELRKRRPQHRTLTRFDERTEEARHDAVVARDKHRKDSEGLVKKAQKDFDEEMRKLKERIAKDPKIDQAEVAARFTTAVTDGQRKLDAQKEELDQQYKLDAQAINDSLEAKIHRLQGEFKMGAVLLPPILPLLIGAVVFFARRAKEREGVSRNRLR